jgi:uncharacterized protein YndB with AHSA1/START domain
MGAKYRFVDTWHVPAPVEHVYDIVGDAMRYPEWWGAFVLDVAGDDGPPRAGRRSSFVVRGFLPYKVRWSATTTDAERPHGFGMALSGDFDGEGRWTFTPDGDGTRAELDWRPEVNKPLIRYLTPLLRPLFAKNHSWAMDRGQEGIVRLIERRRAAGGTPAAPRASGEAAGPPAARS